MLPMPISHEKKDEGQPKEEVLMQTKEYKEDEDKNQEELKEGKRQKRKRIESSLNRYDFR